MKRKKSKVWQPFLKYYTRFPIPWHLIIASTLISLVVSEIYVYISKITIQVQSGELYNSVIIAYSLATLLNAFLICGQNILAAYASQIMNMRAQKLLWKKILHLPQKEIDREQPSNLISGITNDVDTASGFLLAVFGIFSSTYLYVRYWIEMVRFSPDLSFYVMLTIPLSLLLFFVVGKMEYSYNSKLYAALNTMTSFFSEHLTATKFVKTRGIQKQELEAGFKAIDARYKADLYKTLMMQSQTFLDNFLRHFNLIIIAVGGSNLIGQNKLHQTALVEANTYTGNISMAEAELLVSYMSIKGTQGSLRHVNNILDLAEEKLDKGESLTSGMGEICFQNVDFAYEEDHPILQGATMTIPHGKVIAIIGGNGSGKSTVLKLMQAFWPVDSGSISISGQDISGVKLKDLRGRFAYVQQTMPIFSGTVRENIVYGLQEEVGDDEVHAVAKAAGIHDFIMGLPEGYATRLTDDGTTISGGQRQRIALARALIVKPEYLVLDEATASLDQDTAEAVLNAALSRKYAPTVIFVTHNMAEVQLADHVIVMHDGCVEAQGSPAEVLAHSPTYRSFMEKQQKEGTE